MIYVLNGHRLLTLKRMQMYRELDLEIDGFMAFHQIIFFDTELKKVL